MRRLLLALSLIGSVFNTHAQSDSVAVIAHAEVPVDSLSSYQLVSSFSLHQQRWPDGTPVHVFVFPNRHPTHFEFLNSRLNMFSYQLELRWDRAVFAGMASMPTTVKTEAEMLQRVSEVKGALGYIERSELPAQGVKVLEVVHEY